MLADFITNVVAHDFIQRSVLFQLCQCSVELVSQGIALFKAHGIFFGIKNAFYNFQIIVCCNEFFCRQGIDDNTVNLSVFQCLNSIGAFVVTLHLGICINGIARLRITCCSGLYTNLQICQILYGCYFYFLCGRCRTSASCHRNSKQNGHCKCCCFFCKIHFHNNLLLSSCNVYLFTFPYYNSIFLKCKEKRKKKQQKYKRQPGGSSMAVFPFLYSVRIFSVCCCAAQDPLNALFR